MSRPRSAAFVQLILLIALTGCATVDPQPDFERAARHIREATGQDVDLQPGDEAQVASRLEELLADGLATDEAVQVALLNSPTLQAALLDIGLARADVVQSGLFSNPSLGVSVRLPEGGGRSNLEASIAQNIVDLWQIPVRKRAAQRALDATILQVAHEAARLAADTKVAYYGAAGAEKALEISRENLEIAHQLLDAALARQRAGTVGELDVNLARSLALDAELGVFEARLDADVAKRRLAELLGLPLQAGELALTDELPALPEENVSVDRFLEIALDQRLDLQAARHQVQVARERIREEYSKVFPNLEVGLALERGERRAQQGRNILGDTARASVAEGQLTAPEIQPRSERRAENRSEVDLIIGPSLDLTLPIFDQNQAQIAKAKMAHEQSIRTLEAMELTVIQDTRQAVDRALTAWRIARFYEDEVLPQAESTLDLSAESYRAGRESVIVVLDAERSYLAVRRAHVAALRSAAVALAELERVTARPISSLLDAMENRVKITTRPMGEVES